MKLRKGDPLWWWRWWKARKALHKAGGKYMKGMASFLADLEGIKLPPRGSRGSEENRLRSMQVQEFMHSKRLEFLKKRRK